MAPDVAPDMGAGRRTRAMAAVGLSSREGCRGGDEAAFGLKARSIQTTTKVKRKAFRVWCRRQSGSPAG